MPSEIQLFVTETSQRDAPDPRLILTSSLVVMPRGFQNVSSLEAVVDRVDEQPELPIV